MATKKDLKNALDGFLTKPMEAEESILLPDDPKQETPTNRESLLNELSPELRRSIESGDIAGKRRRGRPTRITEDNPSSKTTVILPSLLMDKIKALAYMEGRQLREIIEDAIATSVAKYERKNGEIVTKGEPKSKKGSSIFDDGTETE